MYVGFVAALLPVLLLRDFTPANELRYLSIADEALRNHALFAFTNHGVPYADKPPLYLWIVVLCRWLTGAHRMWLVGLFSLLPALGVVWTMDKWTKEEMDGESHALARLMTLTSGLFMVCAVTIRMDMLMCLFIVLALREFWLMHMADGSLPKGRQKACGLLFPLYIFLAVFTKGPLGLLIPLVGTVAFIALSPASSTVSRQGRARLLCRAWGWRTWGVLAVLCSLWFAAAWAEGGSGYVNNLLFHQTIGRAVNSFHHNHPFYYYLVHIWYCLAPWSLVVVGVFVAALRPRMAKSDLQRFFLTTGAAGFVLLSCISSKLEIYLLPIVPFLTYSAAMFLPRFAEGRWVKAALAATAAVLALSLPALCLAASVSGLPYLDNGLIYASATILSLTGAYVLYLTHGRAPASDAMRHIGTGMLIAVFTAAFAMPKINEYTGFRQLCGRAEELSLKYRVADFRSWHIRHSANMDAYLNRPVEDFPDEATPKDVGDGRCVLLIKKEDLRLFKGKASETTGTYAIVVCPRPRRQEPNATLN